MKFAKIHSELPEKKAKELIAVEKRKNPITLAKPPERKPGPKNPTSKSYQCEICGKHFSQPYHMQEHMTKHTKV